MAAREQDANPTTPASQATISHDINNNIINTDNSRTVNIQNGDKPRHYSGNRHHRLNSIVNLLALTTTITFIIGQLPILAHGYIQCYQCMSNQPGCGEDGISWFFTKHVKCPQNDDKCVKIIERKEIRSDVPGDKYEGCRPAAPNPKIGNFILDIFSETKPQPNVTYCFCDFEDRCNSSISISPSIPTGILSILTGVVLVLISTISRT